MARPTSLLLLALLAGTAALAEQDQAAARRLLLGAKEAPLGRRALLDEPRARTFEVDIGQGDLWRYQSETTVSADVRETESGGRKIDLGVSRGRAFAANGLECLTKDCEEPVAEVRTQVTPGSDVAGPQATAEATARGDKISATRTNTASLDYARNGDDIALAAGFSNSNSVQEDGRPAGSFSTVQANAAAGPDLALWTGAGIATAQPFGDNGKKDANVWVRGIALVDALSSGYRKSREDDN